MDKPRVQHAGCGGRVTVVQHLTAGPRLMCERCGHHIVEALELEKRPSGFTPSPNATRHDFRMEA